MRTAEERLTAELTRPRARFRARPLDPDGRIVVGQMLPGHRIRAFGGRAGWDNSFVPFLCVGAVFTAMGVVLPGWAGRAGRRDSGSLRDRLHERLQVR